MAKVDSQWQKMNQGIPQWQKVEYWYSVKILLKCSWDISWFKNPKWVVPMPKQWNHQIYLSYQELFMFLSSRSQTMRFPRILHNFYWCTNKDLITWIVGGNIFKYCMGSQVINWLENTKSLTKSKFYLNHLQFCNVLTDTRVILKGKMLNEKLTFHISQT